MLRLISVSIACFGLLFFYSFQMQAIEHSGSNLESATKHALQKHKVAGAAVARIEDNKLVELFSVNNPELKGKGVNKESVFQVGSISKPVTAWALMTLVRDGKIALNDSVWKHVSRWQVGESKYNKEDITVRRLLSHTAGLSLHGYPGFKESIPLPSIEASLLGDTNRAGDVHLFQQPGSGYSYSGGGYTLLQLLVEEVSGLDFHRYVEQAVLSPLGMNSSSYLPTDSILANRSQAFRLVNDPISQYHFRAQAAASLHSTAADLAKFIIANISENPVLSRDLVEQMHTGDVGLSNAEVGLGFFISKNSGLIGHGGSNLGWRAELTFSAKKKSGLVILTNSERGERLIPEVKCVWLELNSPKNTQADCRTRLEKRDRSVEIYKQSGIALMFIAASILILSGWLGLSKQSNTVGISSKWQRSLIIIFSLIILLLGVLALTPLGAYLISGYWSIFSTLHYAPAGSEYLLVGIYALLLSIIALLILIPRRIV